MCRRAGVVQLQLPSSKRRCHECSTQPQCTCVGQAVAFACDCRTDHGNAIFDDVDDCTCAVGATGSCCIDEAAALLVPVPVLKAKDTESRLPIVREHRARMHGCKRHDLRGHNRRDCACGLGPDPVGGRTCVIQTVRWIASTACSAHSRGPRASRLYDCRDLS